MTKEQEEIEKAISNVLRGNDIESASCIVEKVVLDNYRLVTGRINVFKIATRQLLDYAKESKGKVVLDYAKENVNLKEQLKEKDAEIEKLRKHNKELLRKLRNRVKEVKKLQKNPNYKAIVTKQGKTLEERAEQIKKYKQLYNKALDDAVTTSHDNMKKDKMIELMTLLMSNLDIDEEICKHQVRAFCDNKPEGVTLDVCAKCIKQYFERKVE